jgi:methionyl aminopeptidase
MGFKKKKRWHCLPGQPVTELDKQVMYWENKGKEVPTRDMVRTPEQIEGIRIAGKLNTGCLDAVAAAICPGMTTQDIDDICMKYCEEHNCHPSCLNYEGFPKSVCTSINEVVCHGIPKKRMCSRRRHRERDMTLDYNAITATHRACSHRWQDHPREEQLVRVTKECLEIGAEAAKPYCFGRHRPCHPKHAEKYHYGVVRDLCGHGVGLDMHEQPDIVHYGHKGTGMLLVPGMTFTIEPMVNMGTWKVFIDEDDPYGWEVITGDELPSAQWEHTFLMTETGVEVLSE